MTPDAWITLGIVVVLLALLARELASPAAAILGAVVVLLLAGVLTPEQAFAGFSNQATVTIAALFVVARAVRATGGLATVVGRLLGTTTSERAAMARLVAPVAGFSGFLNNTPIVATLAPLVRGWAEARGLAPSRFLIPLSFAAILGGLITTIGTSPTLVVSGLVDQAGFEPFSLFEVTPVGLPLALVGLVVLVLLAPALLPIRRGPSEQVAEHAREYTFRMRVLGFGPVDGRTVSEAGLRNLAGVFLAKIDRPGQEIAPVGPDDMLLGGDVLTFVGRIDHVRDLQAHEGLESAEEEQVDLLAGDGHRFYEVVLGSTSLLVGATLKDAGFRERYGGAVVAIHRAGERVDRKLGEVRLHVGDVLLVLADRSFAERWRDMRDFLLVTGLGDRAQLRPARARLVAVIVVAMVVVAGVGLLPILQAALAAVVALLATRVLTVRQARDSLDLDVLLIVAGSLGLGAAMEASGLAAVLADGIGGVARDFGGLGALAAILLATTILTELISNVAAAALLVPVALNVAATAGADPRGFAVAVAMMASASFLTPIGYQTNTMVYGMGGYRYGDYWRLGLPINLVALTTTLAVVSLVWGT